MTGRRTTLLAVSAAATVALAGSSRASAAAPALTVPNQATITVDGHGFGHGHGLSQYGAEGAARQGLGAQQIVRFYYPHTTSGSVGGRVRVLISADTDQNTVVVARPGLTVRDLGSGRTTPVPTKGAAAKATRWRMSQGSGAATKVSYRTDAWHLWRTLSGNGEFRSTGQALTLVVGGSRVTYRGTLLSLAAVSPTTHRITVNRVSLEGYVQGVVPREMPASWHPAALRAQAIAARTYAAFEVRDSLNPRFNLCDTSSCQVYGGKSAEVASTNAATAKTAGQVRLFDKKPAFTQFSSSSGGYTAAGSQPYLVAQPDPYDGWSGNPNHTWSQTITSGDVEKAWPSIGNLTSISIDDRDGNGQWNGRVVSMTLHGSTGDKALSGDAFRSGLGLRSTWFTLSIAG